MQHIVNCPCGSNATFVPVHRKGTVAEVDENNGHVECVMSCLRTPGVQSRDVAIADWNRLLGSSKIHRVISHLAGHVEDGSNATVVIFQDDATKEWVIKNKDGLGQVPEFHVGASLNDAVEHAYGHMIRQQLDQQKEGSDN